MNIISLVVRANGACAWETGIDFAQASSDKAARAGAFAKGVHYAQASSVKAAGNIQLSCILSKRLGR